MKPAERRRWSWFVGNFVQVCGNGGELDEGDLAVLPPRFREEALRIAAEIKPYFDSGFQGEARTIAAERFKDLDAAIDPAWMPPSAFPDRSQGVTDPLELARLVRR